MRRVHACMAAVSVVLAMRVVAWWAIGDLSEVVDRRHADYVLRPLQLGERIELGLGLGASVVAGVSLVVLAVATGRRSIERRWWAVLVPVLVVGALCGLAYRVMTAAVSGANIGAGMVVLFGPVLVVPALAWSAWNWRMITDR
jgi:hypothetical protein